jgi:hypothetical protein
MSIFIKPWASVGAVFLVWGIGAVSGWFGATRVMQYRASQKEVPANVLNGTPGPTSAFEELLDRNLQLTSDQESKIHQIMLNAGEQARAIREQIQPQMHDLRVSTLRQIEQILDPTQRSELNRRLLEMRRRRARPNSSAGSLENENNLNPMRNPNGGGMQNRPSQSQAPTELPLPDPSQ